MQYLHTDNVLFIRLKAYLPAAPVEQFPENLDIG
jgi:hypothetical protein